MIAPNLPSKDTSSISLVSAHIKWILLLSIGAVNFVVFNQTAQLPIVGKAQKAARDILIDEKTQTPHYLSLLIRYITS